MRNALAFVVLHVCVEDECTLVTICVVYVFKSGLECEIRKVCAKVSEFCKCDVVRVVCKVSGRLIVVT